MTNKYEKTRKSEKPVTRRRDLDFPLSEYRDRVKRIQGKMKDRELDACIVLTPEIIHYICGYDSAWTSHVGEMSGIFIPCEGEPVLLVRSLESKTARKQSTKNPRVYGDAEGPWGIITEIMTKFKATKGAIGIEEKVITLRRYNRLKETFPQAKLMNADGLIEGVMADCSKKEIEYTRKAGAIAQAGFDQAINSIHEGVFLYEITGQVELAMYRAGMTEQTIYGPYILNCVWAGPDGGAMHETDMTKKVQRGDLVTPEVWGNFKHYVAGAQGTVYVGNRPPAYIVDAYKVLSDMYVAVREAMKPGEVIENAWKAGSKVYRKVYGSDYYRMFGRQKGAGPLAVLGKGVKDVFKPGAAFTVQPQVNDPILMTVAATIMVTDSGHEELTKPLLELMMV